MTELSLNVLDIANNSIRAGASLIVINVDIDTEQDLLSLCISDNGCGMTTEQLMKAEDPFFTTRTTRGVGLGIPFMKQAAVDTGGNFHMESILGAGTTVSATFGLSHIDRMPLGDINSTIYTLLIANSQIDFMYTYGFNGRAFTLDTREVREILGDIPFTVPEVAAYIKEYLSENKQEVDGGRLI